MRAVLRVKGLLTVVLRRLTSCRPIGHIGSDVYVMYMYVTSEVTMRTSNVHSLSQLDRPEGLE